MCGGLFHKLNGNGTIVGGPGHPTDEETQTSRKRMI